MLAMSRPDPRIAILDALRRDYYLADAIATHAPTTARHQSGVASGIATAVARVLDIDPIYAAAMLERGKPLLHPGSFGLPADYTDPYAHIEDQSERLDALRRDALKADGHPLYQIIYTPERIA